LGSLQGEVDRARAAGASSALGRRTARRLQRRAVRAFYARRIPLATQLLEAACELDPEDLEARANLSLCLIHVGRPDEADHLLQPVIQRMLENPDGPGDPYLLVEWAWLLHERGDHAGALAVLATVRPEGPDDYQSHILAALCWTMLGDRAKADACFDTAFGSFFLDSWEVIIEPYVRRVVAWLGHEGGAA